MAITPAMIKELRERTGVGMNKCKEALEETQGDMEKAIDNLRKSGLAAAAKKSGRETKEGMIASASHNSTIGIVEVNAETDFVVKNDRFQEFLINIAQEVAKTNPASLETFLNQKYSKDPSLTIDQYRGTLVQTIGENIQIRRFKTFAKAANKSIGIYSHLGGKIVTMVEITGSPDEEQLAKEIAMHIAASSPEYLSQEHIPEDVVARERDIAKSQIQGKPANVIEKIVDGKMKAFYDAVCLLPQKYIRDDSLSIAELVEKQAKQKGKSFQVTNFLRWNVGQ
jgi:elongation factor Ts